MRRVSLVSGVSLTVLLTAAAWSASLEEARRLYRAGRLDAALNELQEILDSPATDAAWAQALDLLGTIGVEEDDLPLAYEAWSRLLTEFPDLADTDAKAKLKLVTALMEAQGMGPTAEAEEVESAQLPPRPPPVPAAAAAPRAGFDPKGKVFLAGRGSPHDAVQDTSEQVIAFLRQQGVDVVSATGGIPVVQESKLVLPLLLDKGRQENATSVLLLTAEFSRVQKITVDCFDPDGGELWHLKVSGGTGWTGRDHSPTGVNVVLVERVLEKLGGRVGTPGLPVTLD